MQDYSYKEAKLCMFEQHILPKNLLEIFVCNKITQNIRLLPCLRGALEGKEVYRKIKFINVNVVSLPSTHFLLLGSCQIVSGEGGGGQRHSGQN